MKSNNAVETKVILNKTVKQVFDTDVRDYSVYANKRAIPDLIDGFKPSQRKAIWATIKKSPSIGADGIKVAQLANYAAEITNYHHGEGSLSGTIIKLAQDFTGGNNINYLMPYGQFGNRLSKEAAADRYIFTALSPIFRKVFIKEDDMILDLLVDDGDEIEPERFFPILPNVLINGSDGMGTGYATEVFQYNPEDLKKYITNTLTGKKQTITLVPWYRGYKGEISRSVTGQVIFTGKLDKVNSTTLKITELPIGVWEDDYKQTLWNLQDAGVVRSIIEDSSAEHGFDFEVRVPREIGYLEQDELMKKFKLVARGTENFTVWMPNGMLRCFETAESLCDAFIEFRLKKYETRRVMVLTDFYNQDAELKEKLRFIRYYFANTDKFHKKTKDELVELLVAEKFTMIDKLLDIRLYNLTKDQVDKLEVQIKDVEERIAFYEKVTPTELYLTDLKNLDLKLK